MKKEPNHRFIYPFKDPVQFLQALWTDDIINHICERTGQIKFNSKQQFIKPNDLRRFFGLEMMRGYLGIRNIEHLWSVEDIVIEYPYKENSLPKNHYYAISNALNYDPNFVHQILVENFKRYLIPGYNITVDEIRIPCHHESCPFKNHNRDKPDVWAIESKCMHAENGYLLDFINPIQNQIPTPAESVFQFANWLKTTSRQHHIVMDSNFLSALDLLKLSDMGFESTVSCKFNRPSFIWKQGLTHNLPKSYTRVASSKRLCCIATNNRGVPKIATTSCYAMESTGALIVKERRQVLKIYDDLKGKADFFGHLYKMQYPGGHHISWLTTLLVGWFYFSLTNSFILYSMKFDALNHAEYVYEMACQFLSKK